METKKFDIPKHPTKGEQCVVVEKPSEESVWYFVVESDKSVPLVNLKNPESAKQVLDEAGKQNGESFVAQFVMGGFSKVN